MAQPWWYKMVRAELVLRPATHVNNICLSLVDRQVSVPEFAAVVVVQEGEMDKSLLIPLISSNFANLLIADSAAEHSKSVSQPVD